MFQRNGRSGYVLKPTALREGGEKLLSKYTKHVLNVTVSLPSSYPSLSSYFPLPRTDHISPAAPAAKEQPRRGNRGKVHYGPFRGSVYLYS